MYSDKNLEMLIVCGDLLSDKKIFIYWKNPILYNLYRIYIF